MFRNCFTKSKIILWWKYENISECDRKFPLDRHILLKVTSHMLFINLRYWFCCLETKRYININWHLHGPRSGNLYHCCNAVTTVVKDIWRDISQTAKTKPALRPLSRIFYLLILQCYRPVQEERMYLEIIVAWVDYTAIETNSKC